MKAQVIVLKSFDKEGKTFTTEISKGDLQQFMTDEGAYLERLSHILNDHGTEGQHFTVTYHVSVTI